MMRHELSPCAKDVTSSMLHQAIEDGTEKLKLTVLGLTSHLEAGELGQHSVAAKMICVGERPH